MISRKAVFMSPKELYEFIISNPKDTKLPENPIIICDQTLDLGGSDICWLPEELYAKDDLIIDGCQKLLDLPTDLFVGGDLYMRYSKIRAITDGLRVCGNIYAEGMNLDFPDDYVVYRGLYLNSRGDSPGAPLDLRNIVSVYGVLDVRGRQIAEWPHCVKLTGRLLADEIGKVVINRL